VVLAIALVMGMASSPVQAAPQTSNIDVDDAVTSGTNSFTYSGLWVNCGACNSGAFSNSFRYSYSPGANATLSFSGTQATLYGYRERTGGIANVSVDNGPPVQVDYYSADQKLVEVYKSPVLKSGLHRLTLTVTGKRGAGVSPTINIDRAVIESGAGSLPPTTAPPAAAPPVDNPATGPGAGRWMSGASGEGVGNGKFGVWRGTTVPLAVTWSDISFDAAVNSYQFEPGAEYGSWTGSADWAFGGIWAGDTWSAAASGAYDSRWSQILSNLKNKWQAKQRGTLYIRFAHEMNGNWSNHSVSASDAKYFVTAWKRFYAIKQRVFPGARVTFSTNGNTVGQQYDWRTLWPGDAFVDVYSTDWYAAHWKLGGSTDRFGAPQGLEQHRLFAKEHGKPFAVSEWGNQVENGDQPKYVEYMHDFFTKNAGTGAGQLLYEGYFNVIWTPNTFGLFPESKSLARNASAKYRDLF